MSNEMTIEQKVKIIEAFYRHHCNLACDTCKKEIKPTTCRGCPLYVSGFSSD